MNEAYDRGWFRRCVLDSFFEIDSRYRNLWRQQDRNETIRMLDEGYLQKDIASVLKVSPGYISKIKIEAVKKGLITKEKKLTSKGRDKIRDTGWKLLKRTKRAEIQKTFIPATMSWENNSLDG